MSKPPKCRTCKDSEVVYNIVRGKGFWFCRGCKKEVPSFTLPEDYDIWNQD